MSEATLTNCRIIKKPNPEISRRVKTQEFRTFLVGENAKLKFEQRVQPLFPDLVNNLGIYWTIKEHIQTGTEIEPNTEIYTLLMEQRRFPPSSGYQYRAWAKKLINHSEVPFTFFYPCAYYLEKDKLVVLTVTLEEYLRKRQLK